MEVNESARRLFLQDLPSKYAFLPPGDIEAVVKGDVDGTRGRKRFTQDPTQEQCPQCTGLSRWGPVSKQRDVHV